MGANRAGLALGRPKPRDLQRACPCSHAPDSWLHRQSFPPTRLAAARTYVCRAKTRTACGSVAAHSTTRLSHMYFHVSIAAASGRQGRCGCLSAMADVSGITPGGGAEGGGGLGSPGSAQPLTIIITNAEGTRIFFRKVCIDVITNLPSQIVS